MKRKRKATDATLRNVKASVKRDVNLARAVEEIRRDLARLQNRFDIHVATSRRAAKTRGLR